MTDQKIKQTRKPWKKRRKTQTTTTQTNKTKTSPNKIKNNNPTTTTHPTPNPSNNKTIHPTNNNSRNSNMMNTAFTMRTAVTCKCGMKVFRVWGIRCRRRAILSVKCRTLWKLSTRRLLKLWNLQGSTSIGHWFITKLVAGKCILYPLLLIKNFLAIKWSLIRLEVLRWLVLMAFAMSAVLKIKSSIKTCVGMNFAKIAGNPT